MRLKKGDILRLKHEREFVRVIIPDIHISENHIDVFYGICISDGLPEEFRPYYKGLQMDYPIWVFRKSSQLEFWVHSIIVKFTKWYFDL